MELILCRNSSAERRKNEGLFSMKGQKYARGTVGRIVTNELDFGWFQFRECLGIRNHCRVLSPGRVDREMRRVSHHPSPWLCGQSVLNELHSNWCLSLGWK